MTHTASTNLPLPAAVSPPPLSAAAGPSPSPTLPSAPARFVGASLTTTLLSLALLAALVRNGLDPVVANLVATSAGATGSYWLNRHWVWQRQPGGVHTVELAAFWGLALGGLALSTLTVNLADDWAEAAHATNGTATAVAVGANWAAFLSLALVKFAVSRRLYGAASETRERPALQLRAGTRPTCRAPG